MGKIQVLDSELINLIAAGEVVERPSSIVKELIENSIDADATEIIVRIKDGGVSEIQVQDNGSGMDPTDATLAFTQHATSKIVSAEDLFNITSLGFRGEALASISSVSEVTLDTKAKNSESVTVASRGGQLSSMQSAKADVGTVITVSDLFRGIPARKNFLRSENTELSYILNVFLSISLTSPKIHFELWHNNRLTHRLPSAGDTKERILQIYGDRVAENLFIEELQINDIRLSLIVGSPDLARKDRKLQYIFVNGRSISDRALQKAITQAYSGYIHKDLQPVYFIFIDIPPELVDVNVHPRKLEVRFKDSQFLFHTLHNTLKNLLNKHTKQELLNRLPAASDMANNIGEVSHSINHQTEWGGGIKTTSRSSTYNKSMRTLDSLSFTQNLLQDSMSILKQTEQVHFVETTQLFLTYIMYQLDEEIIFVDQHAAAEKIMYERLMNQLEEIRSKNLLVPEILELSQREKSLLISLSVTLKEVGIEIADFGGNAVQLIAIPELLQKFHFDTFVQEILEKHNEFEELKESSSSSTTKQENFKILFKNLIATMACHASVRAGQKLSQAEMQQIVNDLSKCEDPYNCPHGRPVSVRMHKSDLAKLFKRIV